MSNPVFYERQRRRASTWNVRRFLRSYDETLDGSLILPRGLLDTLTRIIQQAGSTLQLEDARTDGAPATFTSPRPSARSSRTLKERWRTTISACSSPHRAPERPSSPAP
jgi:hypothetical protein